MSKVLVVEDDPFFREAIVQLLKEKKYEVLEAPNGKVARETMLLINFDVVLSDIQMPQFNGIELLEWSKEHRPTPFIMMTGFSMLLETKNAYELGAKEFIAKPFQNADLIGALEKILPPPATKVEVKAPPLAEYCKVSIDEFVARPHVEFDVYIRLSDNKYIKLVHKGEQISSERVKFYKEKGLRFLYITKDDFGKLVDFNLDIGHLIKDRKDISQEKKMNFMKYTGEVILEKAFVDGVDKESFQEAQEFLNMTISVISDSKETFDLLNLLNSHSDYIYAHSVGVAMYSVMIARKMGFHSNQVFFKLSMAAMFHDIGKKEIDRVTLEKPRHQLSTAERRAVESHVTRSQEILMAIHGISEDIVQIVYEHHEDFSGQGFPNQKVKAQQHPLSKILQCANLFMEQALKGPNNPGMPGATAVSFIERVYNSRLDPDSLKALKSLFQQ